MADKITKLYNLAKERGVLTDGLTEDMFRKQTDTEEKLKGFYDIASPKIKLGSWDTFKTNFQNASAPQQETKPEAQPQKRQGLIGGFAAATAPQTLTETDVDYSKSAEGMQDAAIKRQNAAKLPGEKKERNDVSIGESYQKPYDLITGNIPDDVTLNAEGLTIQTAQAEKERADIANQYAQNKEYPHSPYKPVDPAEELDKKYPTGKYTNQEEIYQAVWSSAKQNDPELAKRFADADAELQALIDETKTNLKKTEDELVGLVRSGKMSTEEAQDRYNTIHDEEVAKVGAFQERTFTKIYNSANEKYQDYIIGQTRKLAQRELASELPAIKEEALKAARVSDVSTDRYAVSAAEIADRAMKLNNAGINRDKEGFGAGFKAGITDSYTWTSGVLEAIHGVQGKKVLDKYYAGEQLTEGENALLKSLTYYMAAEAYNSPLLKRMYKAGMTSAQSIPFMLEFVAANPALLQDAVIKKLVGYGMEEFGKQGGKVLAKELGTHALGTMAGAGAMTATFGAPRIVAGTAQRMNGTVETPFSDGTSAFTLGKREGQQSFGEAAWNATVDTFVENLSEMILTNNPLTKRFGEAMKPITSTMADNPIGQIVAKIWDTPQWKEFATRAQYGGSIEEFNEELIGNVMRWGFSTDTHDKNKTWRENAGLDADTLTDTALGVIPMTMAMTGGNLLFGASITIADVVSDKKLVKKAGVGAILDEISKAKASNDMIIPMTSLHKSLQENKELTQDEKNKIFDSAENELIKKIREEAEEQRAKDEETANLTPAEEEAKAAVDNINEQTNDDDELMYNVSVSGKDGEWRIKGGTPIHVDENGQLVSDEDLTGKPEFYKPTIVVIGTDANGKKVEFQTTIDKLTLLDQPISAEQAAAGVATNLAADKVMEAENAEHVWYEKDGQAFELTKDGDEYTFVASGDKVDASMLADMGYKETADPNAPVETPEAAEPERTPVQIATDDFVAKHGENAVTKLGTTIKAVEKDKKDAEKKLADAKKKLADLPDAYNEATRKAEEKAQQDVANAQAKVDEYSGILERYNGIKAEMDARAAAEIPAAETPAEQAEPTVPADETPAVEAPAEPSAPVGSAPAEPAIETPAEPVAEVPVAAPAAQVAPAAPAETPAPAVEIPTPSVNTQELMQGLLDYAKKYGIELSAPTFYDKGTVLKFADGIYATYTTEGALGIFTYVAPEELGYEDYDDALDEFSAKTGIKGYVDELTVDFLTPTDAIKFVEYLAERKAELNKPAEEAKDNPFAELEDINNVLTKYANNRNYTDEYNEAVSKLWGTLESLGMEKVDEYVNGVGKDGKLANVIKGWFKYRDWKATQENGVKTIGGFKVGSFYTNGNKTYEIIGDNGKGLAVGRELTTDKEESVFGDNFKEITKDEAIKNAAPAVPVEEPKTYNNIFEKALATQSVERVPVKPSKVTPEDFTAKKDKVRPVMMGVYHGEGFSVATDAYMMFAQKENYDPSLEGKITLSDNVVKWIDKIRDKNEQFPDADTIREMRFPNWKKVIPDTETMSAGIVDVKDLREFIAGCKELVYGDVNAGNERTGSKYTKSDLWENCSIYLTIGGLFGRYKASNFEKFVDAMEKIGANTIFMRDDKHSIVAQSDNGNIILMPLVCDEKYGYKPFVVGNKLAIDNKSAWDVDLIFRHFVYDLGNGVPKDATNKEPNPKSIKPTKEETQKPDNADELLKKIYDDQYETILKSQDYTKKKDFEIDGTIDTYKKRLAVAKREYTQAKNHGTWDEMKEAIANLARKQAFYKAALDEKDRRTSAKEQKLSIAEYAAQKAAEAKEQAQAEDNKEQETADNKEQSTSWGSGNKVFSQDAYEEARARMRARLNHLNAGIDPQALLDGMIVAGYHVEAGARKFVEYAKKMLEDFGEGIRPYLKAYYNGMRDLPEAAELAKEMDDFATVAGIDVNTITLEDKSAEQKQDVLYTDSKGNFVTRETKTEDGAFEVYSITMTDGRKRFYIPNTEDKRLDDWKEGKYNQAYDDMSDTIDRAVDLANLKIRKRNEKVKAAEEEAKRLEEQAKKDAAEAERKRFGGFTDNKTPMQVGNAAKQLDKKWTINGGSEVKTASQWVDGWLADGTLKTSVTQESKYADISRDRWNRMTLKEQEAHEKKMQEKKDVYRVNGFDFGKTVYEYANYVLEKQKIAADTKPESKYKVGEIVYYGGKNGMLQAKVDAVNSDGTYAISNNSNATRMGINMMNISEADLYDVKDPDRMYDFFKKSFAGFIEKQNFTKANLEQLESQLEGEIDKLKKKVERNNGGTELDMVEGIRLNGALSAVMDAIDNMPTEPKGGKKAEPSEKDSQKPLQNQENSVPLQENPAIGKVTKDVDTRDNTDLWVVKPEERTDKETFDGLKKRAKAFNGAWSGFKKGFIFRSEEEANNFNNKSVEAPAVTEAPKQQLTIREAAAAKAKEKKQPKEDNNGESNVRRSSGSSDAGGQMPSNIERVLARRRSKATGQDSGRDDRGGEATGTGGRTSGDVGRLPSVRVSGLNKRNFTLDRGQDAAPTTNRERYAANVAAIRLLKKLQEEEVTEATKEQQEILSKFSGWGGLGEFFNSRSSFRTYNELKSLLTEEEFDAANMSRNSAYFTPSGFVDIMWDIARKMGYRGGRFAENSAGIGNIISHMPADLADKSVVSAVEIDPITGGMLKYLYPDAEVHNTGFENVSIPNNSIDLEITNVPFVTGLRVSDKDEKDLAKRFKNLHDFCIAKNIRKLSEGGIGIFITTSGTLDSSRDLRNWITKEGNTDVVGAFRLNSESFGGASVTSDIIVVRKRVNGEVSPQAINVLETGIVRNTVDQEDNPRALSCNKYFIEHPEFMGGEMGFGFEHGDTRWGGTTTQCYPSADINQEERLKNWLNTLMEQKPVEKKPIVNEEFASNKKYEEVDSAYSEGELITTKDGTVCVSRGGRAVPLDVNANKVKGQTKAQCIADYNAIKYALEDLLAKEQETNDDAELAPYLKELNRAYDNFVSIYGNLNKNTAISFLKNDVYFPGIASLEHYEETEDINGKKKITTSKTDIFNKRVLGVKTEVKATNAKDGVILSMRQYGEIRPSEIASWLGKDIESVKKEIVESGLGFIDPVSENVVVSYEYLSGNVREKLEYAKSHNTNGVYDKNIEALNKVIPTTIPSSFIQFQLGSTWIPVELYGDYVRDKFGIENVNFANAANTWVTNAVGDYQLKREKNRGAGVHSDLLNKDATGFEIFMNAINNKPTTLSVIEKDMDGRSHTVVDKDASQAASAKADEMRDDFVEYVRGRMSDDQELAMRMEKTYNDKFNAIAPKKIGAEFMSATLEGMNPNIKLRPHQQEAVVIATTQPVMLAHEVGTGKTFTMISAAMEMRRLGTAKKPMIVVQNATVGQFVASAKLLYPSARVLTVSEKDKSAEGRKEFYAKIKYNDWDLIIVPQSVFDMIPDNEERMQAFIQEKIDEKMAAINQAKAAKVDTRKISALESELKKLQDDFATGNMSGKKNKAADEKKEAIIRQNASVRAEEQMDRKTDDTEDFDTMGIDALLIDEAHNYKHLGFSTNMQRGVKGVDPSYSKRAAALYIKCQSIFERCGHKNVVFATGTPISNTAAEIWTFMKYLYPADFLKANDIYYFDDFVHNFGRISQSLEFTTSGQFKENSRFASYSNIPELARIWSNIAHTILTKEVGEVKDMVPEMEGGKAKDVFLPQSQTLINIMAYVRQQMKEFEEADGRWKREHSYVPLVMFGIARRGAIDPRLVMEKAKDEPESKTNHVVSDVLQALKDSEKYNGTCAVFCDSYRRLKLVGKKKVETFNIFKDIRDKLIKQGVPADQIVIMESNMSIAKKEKIFADVNAGRVRVILGTTATLGTGVNIQERLFFEGHMDTPDRPMDYTQRNGRILRQGNLHKQWGIPVRVVRYGVEDSLDVTGYQRLKTKSQFIDSIMESKRLLDNNLESRMLEESEEGLFDNPVAVLSGSQYAMLKSQAERELRKLESKKNDFMRQQIEIESRLRSIANQVSFKSGVLQKMLDREALIKEVFPNHTVDKMTIDGMDASTDEAKKEALKAVRDKITDYMNSVTNDSTIRPESSKTHNIPFTLNDVDFVLQLTLTKKVGYKDGEYKHYTDRKFAVKCPRFSIDQEVNSVDVKNIIDGIISSYIVEDSASSLLINRYKVEIADYRKDIDELNKRRGMVFTGDADIEKARKRVEEYTELMREEMAEKQSKYAGQETGDIDLDSEIVDEDESDGEVSLSAGDNQGVEEYENGLTEAQQAATDAVITMLEDAGIKVNRISNEEADKLSEEEGASFSKRVSPDPKKTQKVYKLMRLGKDGKLYPLFIDASEGIELGSWWDADSPNMDMLKDMPSGVWLVDAEKQTYQSYDEFYKEHPEMFRGTQTKFPSVSAVNYATANGLRWVSITDEQRAQKRYGGETRKYMNLGINGSGTVSEFAMRPGWHAGSLPSMRQIGKGKNKDLRDDSFVWVEGEVPADIDYQVEADANPDKDIPTHIPTDGYYMKATNADKGKSQSDKIGWYVAGSFKPVRIMSDSEARSVIDQWNNEHPNEQVAYDYQRESGMEFNAETMQLEKPSVAMSQSGEKVYGFTKDGEITLSERGINPNTPAHEYSHVWCPAVRIGNPKLWANVKELFKPYLDEVRNDEAYKGLSEDGMVEEAVARFSGKRGAERAVAEAQRLIDENPSIKGRARARMIIGRIKQALDKLWSWIGKNLFKIERFNSPEEVADRIMYDLVNKTNLRTGKVGEGMTQEDIDAISRKEANYQRTSGSWKDELEDSTDPHAMTIPEKILSNTIAAAVEHEENTRLATEAVRQINARLADLRKAMYQQKITDRDALDKLTSMAKIFLKNGWVGANDKAELREVISTIGKAANGTMEDNIQRMMMAVTKSHLSHTREAFNTLRHTKSQKLNISGVVEQGAVDVETQYRLATFNEGIKVKAEKLDEYIHEALDKYNRETDDTKKAQYASAAYGYMVAQKYLETVGELREEAVELEKVLREVKEKSFKGAEHPILAKREALREAKEAIITNRLEQVKAYDRMNQELFATIYIGKAKAAAFRKAQVENMNKIRHFANSDTQGVSTSQFYKSTALQNATNSFIAAGGLFSPLQSLNSMLKVLAPKAPNGQGYLYDHFIRGYVDSSEAEYRGLKEVLNELDAKAAEILGNKADWADMAEKLNKGNTLEVSILEDDDATNVELTQGQLGYLYAINKMADGRMKLRAMGIAEADMARIEEALDPKVKELMDWLQSDFLPRTRNKYNKVYEQMFGAPMAAIDNYFPLRINKKSLNQSTDLANDMEGVGNLSGTTTGAIKERRRNSKPIDIMNADAFNVMIEHLTEMEHWAAFAQLNRDANILMSYTTFKNKLGHMTTMYGSGKQLEKNLKDCFKLALGTYDVKKDKASAFELNLAKGISTSKITLRIWTAAKQILSHPAFYTEIAEGDGTFVPEYLKNLATPYHTYKWAMDNLPLFEKRVRSRQVGDTRLMDNEEDWKVWHIKGVEWCTRIGMSPNAFVDALTCAQGAKAVYESHKRMYINRGMSEADAEKRSKQDASICYNETQQSSEGAFVSTVQRDQNAQSIFVSLFNNANMAYMRRLNEHAGELYESTFGKGKDEQIEYLTKKYIRMGLDEDNAAKYAKTDYNRSIGRSIFGIATFGYLMQAIWRLGGYIPYLLFGDDDDEKEKLVKKAFTGGALATPVRGTVLGKGLEAALDGYGWKNVLANTLPIEEDIKNYEQLYKSGKEAEFVTDMLNMLTSMFICINPETLTNMGIAIVDAFDGDLEYSKDFTTLLFTLMSVPESQIKKMYVDELGASGEEILRTVRYNPNAMPELAKRYAERNMKRTAPFFPRSEEEKQQAIKSSFNSIKREATERIK